MTREIEVKTERLQELMAAESLDGILLNSQHNFAWITAGADNGVDRSREIGAASILVTRKGRRFLLSNNIEMPRLTSEQQVPDLGFEPVEFSWQAERSSPAFLVEKASQIAGGEIATDIPLHAAARPLESNIARCRYQLTPEERSRYRDLGQDAAAAMSDCISRTMPGETEVSIAAGLRRDLALKGIDSIVTLVAGDSRIDKFRHPVPTVARWTGKLMLVTCAKRSGLIASLSRIVHVGAVPSELKERTEAAAYVSASLLNATREGVSGSQLYRTACEAYAYAGFPLEIDKHHQGGATGYRTREWVAHPESTETVRPDQAFAWNPSVAGTKIEETAIAGGGVCDVITASPGFPSITHTIDGAEYHSPGILEI